jgi:Outer membrane protein beta-barrel domain
MKKITTKCLLVLGCWFGLSLGASAQTVYMKPHFGVRAGLNSAYTSFSPNFIYVLRLQSHLNLGAFYRIRSKKLVFQPEVQYQVKGGTFKGETEVIRNNFNYLSLTPVVGYVLTEGLTLEAVPEYSFALNDARTNNGPEQKRDFGMGIGLRYDVLDAGEDFSLNLRYTRGFTNLTTVPSQTQYNSVFQVSVIYNFYRKK